MKKASGAETQKNYSEAIRRYVQVISETMAEVRKAQKEKPGDSNIDL